MVPFRHGLRRGRLVVHLNTHMNHTTPSDEQFQEFENQPVPVPRLQEGDDETEKNRKVLWCIKDHLTAPYNSGMAPWLQSLFGRVQFACPLIVSGAP